MSSLQGSLKAQFLLLLCLFYLAMPVFAQETTGSIVGVVKDASGSVITGASVTLVNEETDIQSVTNTDESGAYQFPLLRAGRYRMMVDAPGFQKLQRDGIIVNTTERVRLDLNLQVGAVNETVTVVAETPLLQSEKVTIGQVVEQRTIQSIPLATRNFTQMLGTSAGVLGGIMNADKPGTGSDSASVNGARRGSNNLLVDGVPTTNTLNNAPDGDGTPSIEFLSEFKVMTSLYSAEYGRNSGSIINVTTRSGSNDLHGTLYEYLRNTDLNARPFFFPTRVQNNQNQFGANAGGKILRDKTFFFAGWESSRQLNANSSDSTLFTIVPTADQRQGIFSSKKITDPSTGQPFLNNVIPQSRLNPISLNIQKAFIPVPNYSAGGSTNFFASAPDLTNLDQFTGRIDHRWGSKDSLFGRWFESWEKDLNPFGKGMPGFDLNANRKKHSGGFSETHVFSPTVVLESRFGVDVSDQFISFDNNTDPKSLGLQPISGVTRVAGVPRINISNYANGGFGNDQDWHDNIHTYTSAATMTWVRSRHTLKFGGENRTSILHPINFLSSRGVWNFNGQATGDEYADFLLSIPRTMTFGAGPGELQMREEIWNGFIDDSWKATPTVTVSAGLRYEAHFQPAAYNLHMVSFWPDRYKGVGSLDGSGIVQGGINGVPNNVVFGNWHNFAPRLGIAWRIGNNWVIRTGAGLYFDQRTGQIAQQTFSNPPTFIALTLDCAVAGTGCTLNQPQNWAFVDPHYDPKVVPFPTSPNDQIALFAVDPHVKTDNAWQYNFTIQRQLPSNLLLEAGYVGTKGTHLMATRFINPLMPQADGTLVRRFPGFANITMTLQDGNSTYHSFQTTLKRRVASSTFQLAYTISKTLTSGNESARFFTNLFRAPWNDWSRAKGPANFDRPQRLVFTYVQDLPSKFTSRLGKVLLNNWSASGVVIAQSGFPLTVFNRDSGSGLGGTTADVTGNFFSSVAAGAPLIHPSGSTKDNLQSYVNKAAWIKAPFGTFGNSGRGMFRGPGQWDADFSVLKDFKITERFRLQFRTEFFNILNHANFALGSDTGNTLSLDSGSFGQITSTSVNARLIQFALRLSF